MKSAETVLDSPHQTEKTAPQMEARVIQKSSTAPYTARRRKRIRVQLVRRRRLLLAAK